MGNDREKALALHEWNLDLSGALIVPLQVCEVAVRNGVAEAIERVHRTNWPWNNGFIRSLPRPKSRSRYNPLSRMADWRRSCFDNAEALYALNDPRDHGTG
ncbi:hypothetical protein [Tardiphaga sp.]|uniref:hypothetical protein n=1 Tax=Tardiphaga sp. TaxID=1926292 RepID=UPI00352BA23E